MLQDSEASDPAWTGTGQSALHDLMKENTALHKKVADLSEAFVQRRRHGCSCQSKLLDISG